jgi:glycosyltransferase involved in cell wall biosynthesis
MEEAKMRIGIMLRHLRQHHGGLLVASQGMLGAMLTLDTCHEFVLIYPDPQCIGTFTGKSIREVTVTARSVFLWDQLRMPQVEKQEKLDLIFNPKYSLPLRAKCRTVFTCHGLDWYVMPWGSRWIDRMNHHFLVPRYAKKADAIIAVSETTRQHVLEYWKVPEERVHTVYHGVDEAFRQPLLPEQLEAVRRAYNLPERFFLYCGNIYPPKNFGRLLQAYAQVGPKLGVALVVAGGQHLWLCEQELALIDRLNLTHWVVQSGWVVRNIMPAFYAMAEALLMPSLYESFAMPVLESMASGCPVVTSDRHGTAELAAGAAMLVQPEEVESIVEGLRRVATDHDLRQQLIVAGRERASGFTWKKCAQETLQVLEKVLT